MKKYFLLLSCLLFLGGCNKAEEPIVSEPAVEIVTETIEETVVEEPYIEELSIEEIQIPEPEELPPYSYEIVMVGDVLLHTRVEDSCKEEDGT